MISHYYGIRNFISEKFCENNNPCLQEVKDYKAKEILLGEILFDNIPDSLEKYLTSYEDDYSKLAKIMNDELYKEKISNFKVLDNALKYTDLKNFISNLPKVKDFYFGNL